MEPTLPMEMRAARQEARISVDLLRKRLDLSLPTLAARERNERRLYPDEARRYLKALANLDRERLMEVRRRGNQLMDRGGPHGSELRKIRRLAMISYTTLAPHLGYANPERLRADEISLEAWGPVAAMTYLKALMKLAAARSGRLQKRVSALLGQIEERVVLPKAVDRTRRQTVESRPMHTLHAL